MDNNQSHTKGGMQVSFDSQASEKGTIGIGRVCHGKNRSFID